MATSRKAAIEANKATTEILVQQLSNGTQGAKIVAAHKLRLLAKTRKENRACIAESNYGGSRVLGLVVEVLRFGITTEARKNAAATLFSLSTVHEYKKRISVEDGAVKALEKLLSEGSSREKKDAITT
ncbi:hypothetical protein GIB67_031214 [Kingdonia uniflora]|uniref:Uncharacterized protein n=1 Tax=Kingdonia uniflora TaxID=39325 RepID=A0A7J7NK54_9MAGN|nr:hypothetical protein GIB67_031214 [Kingdonia uniflora]